MAKHPNDDGFGLDCIGHRAPTLDPACASGVSKNLAGLVGFSDPAGANIEK